MRQTLRSTVAPEEDDNALSNIEGLFYRKMVEEVDVLLQTLISASTLTSLILGLCYS